MPDLKTRFRGADRIPAPHLWTEINGREPRLHGRETGPATKFLVATVAFAFAAAGVVLVVRAFVGPEPQLGSQPSPTTSPITSTTARVTDAIDVGRATSVAYGAGSLWVSIDPVDSADRAVLRIDPENDRILAKIPTPVVPGWEIGGGGLTVADGSVWVAGLDASSNGAHGAIVRIDSSTNLVADTIRLEGGKVADVAADGAAIWALTSGNRGGPELVRLDPSSDAVVATIPLSGGYGRSIFATGGSVLVTVAQPPGGPFDGGTLVRIDASTNEVSGTFDLGTYPSVAMDDGTIWAMTDGGLVQIDPATGQPNGAPATVPCAGDALAVGAGGVWCFGAAADRALMRFNPQTGQVDVALKPEEGTGGTALATSPSSVWVVNGTQLVRVDLEGGHSSPTLPSAPGWYTQDGGVVPKGTIPVAWAATVSFDQRDLPLRTVFPLETLRSLPADGIVITVSQGEWWNPPDPGFPVRRLPLQLSDATVRPPEAEEPDRDMAVYELYGQVAGHDAVVQVYFGTSQPEESLVQRAQNELEGLQLPA